MTPEDSADYIFDAEKVKEELAKLGDEDDYKVVQYPDVTEPKKIEIFTEHAKSSPEFDQSTHGTRLDIISKLNQMFAELEEHDYGLHDGAQEHTVRHTDHQLDIDGVRERTERDVSTSKVVFVPL